MAQTFLTPQQVLEHGTAIFKAVLRADPDTISAMIPALRDYVPNGTLGTLTERREAVQLILNFHWKQCLGKAHDGHAMKHYYETPQDVSDLEEPPA